MHRILDFTNWKSNVYLEPFNVMVQRNIIWHIENK